MSENPKSVNGDDTPIWGADIAPEINRSVRQTYHLLEAGLIDADKCGQTWVSTRRRLRKQFAGKAASTEVAA